MSNRQGVRAGSVWSSQVPGKRSGQAADVEKWLGNNPGQNQRIAVYISLLQYTNTWNLIAQVGMAGKYHYFVSL